MQIHRVLGNSLDPYWRRRQDTQGDTQAYLKSCEFWGTNFNNYFGDSLNETDE